MNGLGRNGAGMLAQAAGTGTLAQTCTTIFANAKD